MDMGKQIGREMLAVGFAEFEELSSAVVCVKPFRLGKRHSGKALAGHSWPSLC